MNKVAAEWLKQAEYNMSGAEKIFTTGLHLETVFECHLAVEKALKALYAERTGKVPPKTHDLENLVTLLGLSVPPHIHASLTKLALVHIEPRYPGDLDLTLRKYDGATTRDILNRSKEAIQWIKTEF